MTVHYEEMDKFLESMYPKFYRAVEVTVTDDNGEEKKYFCLADSKGEIYKREEFIELVKKVKDFYMLDDVDELIERRNNHVEAMELFHHLRIRQKNAEGKFLIPQAIYKFKNFNPKKNHWSCKCAWCGKKVSSKTDEGYFLVPSGDEAYRYTHEFFSQERACSEECVKLLWKDKFKNWINENGYQHYFTL